jgi:ATP-dependent Clp protease adaptor protein ClpS
MEFVVRVLQTFFDMDWDSAKQKMSFIHHNGAAQCGVYQNELATKRPPI